MKRNNKGFTLVELMVVVVIIGVLVAIAIPIYNNTTANAQEKACFANQRTIEGAASMYVADNTGKTLDDVDAMNLLVGATKYIKVDPKCGGNSYTIADGVVTCGNATPHGHY
ncbi:MAG: hypothetical protein VR67_12550 [Peptococcaceae bacterium BRH_c8a]|nr:MAG: hypothetical protein VR67_12550 [Peptococcaceae bacterium BRH_c8a]